MAASRPRVFTIPPSAPFLPTLIASLREGRLIPGFPARGDPLALASATIYLPTRRACRLAHDLFLDALDTPSALLPRLVAIGDIDEDELIFTEAAGPLGAEALDLPEALSGLERKLLLAQLILQWTQSPDVHGDGRAPLVANTPAAALALAEALAHLIDDMVTRRVPWSRLDRLAPDHLDPYWQLTLKFLQVARKHWPDLLAERGAIEPAERRDRLIAAEAARLARAGAGPVIAAGSTASMPATAMLLSAIARLPRGAVVLPGLDTGLDDPSWELIGRPAGDAERLSAGIAHPQFAMRGFLAGLGVHREEVVALAASARPARERLASEALRPAAVTDRWHERLTRDGLDEALAGVAVIDAASAEEEALAIAVAMREAVEDGRSAALVTPDRALARRVIAALARWNVAVDDSAGDPLADTPAGVFARLCAEVALAGVEPVSTLALLKHPLMRLGASADVHRRAVSILERAALRGPRPAPGTRGLAHALAALRAGREALHRADPRRRLSLEDLEAADALVERLAAALAPLEGLKPGAHPLAVLASRHRDVIGLLASDGETGELFSRDDGAELTGLLASLVESDAARTLPVPSAEYPDLLRTMMGGRAVRQVLDRAPQVRIFGLLEARLQHADRVVLGGLVEGVWPPQTRSDPWLSRSMRQELGLDLPERRIGLSAHDFAQALGCAEVFCSHAAKLAGAPTVLSRFLQRLAAVAGAERWEALCRRGATYVRWARDLDRTERTPPLPAPAPRPPLDARPVRLSVTEIEDWLRDPYTIYAKRILRLAPLDPVDTPPGARDRGSFIHSAIEEFSAAYAQGLPPDPLAELLRVGEKHFAPLANFPEARAFWWLRFARIADWFVRWEAARRRSAAVVHVEVEGKLEIPGSARGFTLTGRADRIEQLAGGGYAILDYKTGQPPTDRQVLTGLAPQLTLEAAIARQGGFTGIAAGGSIAEVAYVRLRGGEPPGEARTVEFKSSTADAEADKALAKLGNLVARFEDEKQEYRSLVTSMWTNRYGDYDHLARVKEWSATGGAPDPEVPV